MLKKMLCSSAISVLMLNTAMANPAPYVGAGVGLTTNTSQIKKGTNNVGEIVGGNFRGVPFNVFLGYGGVFQEDFYLAGELTATVATANLTNENGLKSTYGYGASVLPGVMLSDHTLAFTRLGVLRSHFPSQSDSRTGGQVGVGLQTCFTQNVDLRFEYDYIAYRSGKWKGTTNSITPRADQFTLNLIYTFD